MNTTDKQIDLIDDAYENFGDRVDEMWQKSGVGDLDDFLYDGLLVDGYDDKGKWFARLLKKEEFINKCKTDEVFSKRWNITIETKELKYHERRAYRAKLVREGKIPFDGEPIGNDFEDLDEQNIPTKLTTIKYNGQIQEIYE